MPLHLLGKKSWNVYNPENIARVRRDEAQAKAQEEEEERRMQEIDAERRIQILRGERPSTPPPPPSAPSDTRRDRPHGEDAGRYRKRRRLAGENDTDRDIRLAREDAQLMLAKREELAVSRTSDAPLLDSTGHINLFPSEAAQKPAEKNREAEKEAADKNRSYEDQYTMRFSNAAGYRQSAGQKPWYSSSSHDALAPGAMPEKDVWGNEDPMRQERERARLDASDPLAAIKRGVRQLKSVELERKKWNQERKRELDALKAAEKQRSRHRRRRSTSRSKASESGDSLEDFSLDAPDKHQDKKPRSSHRHRSYHRERSRGRSPDHSRKRHRHSHSRRDPDHRDHRDPHRGDVREAQSHRRHVMEA